MSNKVPRGIRNNNPFNIKKTAVVWLGECNGDDKVFETFSSMDLGVRAGMKLLMNYIKNGYDTPRKILSRFAPFTENDTQSYLDFVCRYTFLSPDDHISVDSCAFLELCSTIIRYECGLDGVELCDYYFSVPDLRIIFKRYFIKPLNLF